VSLIKIEIAEKVFEIKTIAPCANRMWHLFATDKPADFRIQTTIKDLDHECLLTSELENGSYSHKSEIEIAAIHRKVCEKLIDFSTFMIHGAAFSVGDKGILLCAKSGTGKTTHLFNWLDHCPDVKVINGDKPFILAKEDPIIYGSPWAGKENMCNNAICPLRTIAFMYRGEENKIEEISFSDAFPFLLQHVYRSNDSEKMHRTLQMLKSLNGKVHFYRFQSNNFKEDSFSKAYKAFVGDEK